MGLGHVHRSALVAHVNDLDALRVEPHPDRHDMAAAKREDALRAPPLEQAGDEPGHTIGFYLHHIASISRFAQLPVRSAPESCVLSTRCRILPVAVRGTSSWRRNENDRGRL